MSERSYHGATSRSLRYHHTSIHCCVQFWFTYTLKLAKVADDSSGDDTAFLGLSEARCSSVVRVFAHGAMGRRIDPSWDGPIELFLVRC